MKMSSKIEKLLTLIEIKIWYETRSSGDSGVEALQSGGDG